VDHYIPVPFRLGIYEFLNIFFIIGVVILSVILWLKTEEKILGFSILWFFITLLPVLNIIPIKALIAERFLYIPSLGFCLVVSVLFAKIKSKILAIGGLSILLVFYFFITIDRNRDWQEEQTLWQDTLNVNPKSKEALVNIGVAYARKGNYSKALRFCHDVLKLDRGYFPAYMLMGDAYLGLKEYDKALKLYKKAGLIPNVHIRYHCRLHNNIALILVIKKEYDRAIEICETALRFKCYYPALYLTLGRAYYSKGVLDKALCYYKLAVDKDPEYKKSPVILDKIGKIYAQKKDVDKAVKYWHKALKLYPDYEPAKENLKKFRN
jgi:tetratricopeptide (TPR) repeat protein